MKEIKLLEENKHRPLPNPFVVGYPLKSDSEMFVGRKDIVDHIQREALKKEGGSILFIGQRRSGKTSVLKNLKRYLTSNLRTVYFDCQDPTISGNEKYFCQSLARSIGQELHISKGEFVSCNSLPELTNFLKEIQHKLQQENLRLLLCFDEYERFAEKVEKGILIDLPNAMRHWVQHLQQTIFLFAGSHFLKEIEGVDWTDYLINARLVPISYLDFDSALKLVTNPIPDFGLVYHPNQEIAEKLVHRLGRQPFLIQATMSELVEYLNAKNKKEAHQEDIDIAVKRMLISAGVYFDHIWRSDSKDIEKQIMLRITYSKPLPEKSSLALRRLIKKEILCKERDRYKFCVPVFAEWIKENVDEE